MSATADSETFVVGLRARLAGGPPVPEALWQLTGVLHEQLPPGARETWAHRIHRALATGARAAGLRAVHVWQAGTVLPLLARTAPDGPAGSLAAPADLHRAALDARVAEETWRTALRPVLLRKYHDAYDRAGAYTEAHDDARDYALANGHSHADADAYGHRYAELSTDANADAFAEAHARAVGDALARAYAADDWQAYAATFPGAQLRAVVRAAAAPACGEDGAALPDTSVPTSLAEGFADAVADSFRP
ncbi:MULTISPECIES: hypothetical protein [Streptomyces]|uniref:hypothetical protein n=1 Tax=Streptomyces TaxID=1883 RepID=UPI000A91B369|nr:MULTISPECIES: hypothetical protein [Streptomyces]